MRRAEPSLYLHPACSGKKGSFAPSWLTNPDNIPRGREAAGPSSWLQRPREVSGLWKGTQILAPGESNAHKPQFLAPRELSSLLSVLKFACKCCRPSMSNSRRAGGPHNRDTRPVTCKFGILVVGS